MLKVKTKGSMDFVMDRKFNAQKYVKLIRVINADAAAGGKYIFFFSKTFRWL
jgi:hypothetical protein